MTGVNFNNFSFGKSPIDRVLIDSDLYVSLRPEVIKRIFYWEKKQKTVDMIYK
jgi:hypothetical protein